MYIRNCKSCQNSEGTLQTYELDGAVDTVRTLCFVRTLWLVQLKEFVWCRRHIWQPAKWFVKEINWVAVFGITPEKIVKDEYTMALLIRGVHGGTVG